MKIAVILLACILSISCFAQKKDKEPVKRSDTVRLELTPYNMEVLSGLIKRAKGLANQIDPLQRQLNIVDSSYNAIVKTRLDAQGYDPKKGKYGIVGKEIVYIFNKVDSVKKK